MSTGAYGKHTLYQWKTHTYTFPALGRQRQEDCEFEASLGYVASSKLANTA
jgi:hypothetical protein